MSTLLNGYETSQAWAQTPTLQIYCIETKGEEYKSLHVETVLWQTVGGSLGQELLEEALLLRLGCGGPARALLGPDGPRLVKVGVTAHQVYRALDISEHLNLLYLRNGNEWKRETPSFKNKEEYFYSARML